jgi:hypothetical protein
MSETKDSAFGFSKPPTPKGKLVSDIRSWILNPVAFKAFIDNLNIESIDTVKQRVEKVKTVDELTKYINSGQKAKDVARIQFELEDKDKPVNLATNIDPNRVRQMFGPEKVYNFYFKDLYKTGALDKKLEQFETKLACEKVLLDIGYKLADFSSYTSILNSRVASMTNIVDKLYSIASKLPQGYADRVRKVAEQIQDPGRVTTKNDKKLSVLFAPGTDYNIPFKEVAMMSKEDTRDTHKDKWIKELYKGFLAILKNESTSPLGEGEEVDKVIDSITRATKVTEDLVAKIDKYKRRFSPNPG